MENLNQNLLVSELVSHCEFCLLKLASNELIAHSECQKSVSKYQPIDYDKLFDNLFSLESQDFRFNIKYFSEYRNRKLRYEIKPKMDSDFLCPFGTIKSNRVLDKFFTDLFSAENDDLRFGIECFRDFEGYYLRPEIMIYSDSHYSNIFDSAEWNIYRKLKRIREYKSKNKN